MNRSLLSLVIIILFVSPISSAIKISNTGEESEKFLSEKITLNNSIFEIINQVNESLLKNYLKGLIEIGPRYTGSDNCKKAADYISDEFTKMDLDVKIEPWKYIRYKSENVVATLNGSDPNSDAVIVICAHYDTITYRGYKNFSVGANDDGSGIALMLAIANICSKYQFNHTIKFLAVSGEEIGCYGSYDYAKKAYQRNENIITAIAVDTIGYASTSLNGRYVQMLMPKRSDWLFNTAVNISNKYNDYFHISPVYGPHCCADDESFMKYGYDNCYIGNFAEYPYVHTPDDSFDKINFSYLVNATKFVFSLITYLADKPIYLQVRIIRPDEGSFYIFDKKLFNLPGFNTWRLHIRGLTFIIGSATVEINITSNEEILNVVYSIDNNLIPFNNKEPPYEMKIQGFYWRLTGRRTLGVYVTTVTGKTAYDEMDIFIVLPNLNLWKIFPQRERWFNN